MPRSIRLAVSIGLSQFLPTRDLIANAARITSRLIGCPWTRATSCMAHTHRAYTEIDAHCDKLHVQARRRNVYRCKYCQLSDAGLMVGLVRPTTDEFINKRPSTLTTL